MHRHAHPLRDQLRTEDPDLGEERRELVTTDAGHHVPAAHQQAEGMADDAQQCIAGRVALGVIDLLQPVDVKGEHREWQSRNGAERPVELAPVLQSGERIRGCERSKLHGGFVDRGFPANALDEPAKVVADGGHRLHRSAMRRGGRLSKNREHADEIALASDRKRESAVNVRGRRHDSTTASPADADRHRCRPTTRLHHPAHQCRSKADSQRLALGLERDDVGSSVR